MVRHVIHPLVALSGKRVPPASLVARVAVRFLYISGIGAGDLDFLEPCIHRLIERYRKLSFDILVAGCKVWISKTPFFVPKSRFAGHEGHFQWRSRSNLSSKVMSIQ